MISSFSQFLAKAFNKLNVTTTSVFEWCKLNHGFLTAIAAIVGLVIAIYTLLNQHEQNKMVYEQTIIQKEQIIDQRYQYSQSRITELARIIFENEQHPTLKSYAIREYIGLIRATAEPESIDDIFEVNDILRAQGDNESKKDNMRFFIRKICESAYKDNNKMNQKMINLRNIDLTEVDLSDFDLYCVDLTGANMSRTNIHLANFRFSILDNIKIHERPFGSAMFSRSVLDFDAKIRLHEGQIIILSHELTFFGCELEKVKHKERELSIVKC